MNDQYKYYKKNAIHAVEYDRTNQNLERHFAHRKNLIENHLNIPISLLRGKNILEFGPNSGENSFIYFNAGANTHLVEPDITIHRKINELFKGHGSDSGKLIISDEFIENFQSDKKYDIVVAEGFLHALPNRKDIIKKKIFSFAKSLVHLTYSNDHGYFFESIKRFVFRRITVLRGNTKHKIAYEDELILASKLFKEDFDKLNSARKFESWFLDVIRNPVQTSKTLDSFDDYLDLSNECEFDIYSMSPRWDARNDKKWFKNLSQEKIMDEYHKNLNFIVGGGVDWQGNFDFIALLTRYFLDYSSNPTDKILKRMGDLNLPQIFLIDVNLLINGSEKELLDYFLSNSIFRSWGLPQHHIVFQSRG